MLRLALMAMPEKRADVWGSAVPTRGNVRRLVRIQHLAHSRKLNWHSVLDILPCQLSYVLQFEQRLEGVVTSQIDVVSVDMHQVRAPDCDTASLHRVRLDRNVWDMNILPSRR